jgi:glycosyltransferase involved in cell wall biosynthesis
MIVKNCEKALVHTLKSLDEFLAPNDQLIMVDTGSTDKTKEVARSWGATLIDRPDLCKPEMVELAKKWCPKEFEQFSKDQQLKGGWLESFAEARQIAHDAATTPLIFWIDADDTLQGGAQLRQAIDDLYGRDSTEAIFMRYDYAHDPDDGRVITELWRERVVAREKWEWKGRCHEVLIPKGKNGIEQLQAESLVRMKDQFYSIYHMPDFKKKAGFSDLRNYTILRKEFEEGKTLDDVDPRTIYYLGNAARQCGRPLPVCVQYPYSLLPAEPVLEGTGLGMGMPQDPARGSAPLLRYCALLLYDEELQAVHLLDEDRTGTPATARHAGLARPEPH